jgi:hypothetical protein
MSNTNDFIEKAIYIHNNKYDYSKVNYINCHSKIIIICKEHGLFEQKPTDHISGCGCSKCGIEKNANNTRSNNEEFIKKSILIHGDNYDYSKVEYNNSNEKVIIICKEHGEFQQTPSNHLNRHSCLKCGINRTKELLKHSTNDFIKKAILVHGDKYDYSNVDYINRHSKIIIICKEHEEFLQVAEVHLNGFGCSICSGNKLKTTEEFIKESTLIHEDKYDYSKVIYINNITKVKIICKIHGEFEQIPSSHLIGQRCPICGIIKRSETHKYDTNIFIEKSIKVHEDKYDYSKVEYNHSNEKVIIICKKHGEFEQTPSKHWSGQGCSKCSFYKQYSKLQINWLNFISRLYNININHAENYGEFLIQSTKYKADGYCKETNTIYEFHGDYWHGNPKLFNSKDYNKTTQCTFGELYQKTLDKEKIIKDLGYNLVIIWEYDWNKMNNSIKIIQKKFRKIN